MSIMSLFSKNIRHSKQEKIGFLRKEVRSHYNRIANSLDRWSWYNNSDVVEAIIERIPLWASSVADIGCGPGILAQEVLQSRSTLESLYAIDLSPKMIGLSTSRLSRFPAAEVIESDWLKEAHGIVGVDCVILKNVLHVLDDPRQKLSDLRRILEKNGNVILCETVSPNIKCNEFIRKLFHIIDSENYKVNFFTEHTLTNQMASAGLYEGFKQKGRGRRREKIRRLIPQQLLIAEWLESKCLTTEASGRALEFITKSARDDKLREDMRITFDNTGKPISMMRLQYVGSFTFFSRRILFH